MEQQTKTTETFNVQRRCEEIHAQFGTSEMANYRIQQMCDKIAQDAFNEGRQSVIDNVPDLEWINEDRLDDFENCIEEYYALTPFGDYSILQWYSPSDFTINFGGDQFRAGISSICQAKQIVNEDYKNRITKALGL